MSKQPTLFFGFIFLGLLSISSWAAESPTPAVPASFELDRIEDNVLHFKGSPTTPPPAPLKTSLHEIEYFGMLRPREGALPYVILGAKPCKDCEQWKNIYIIRVDGEIHRSFLFPGEVRDRKTKNILIKSQAFFGECLNGRAGSLVVFQDEKVDRRRAHQSSVFLAEVKDDDIYEKLFSSRREKPSLSSVKAKVKGKTCQQIKGYDRLSLKFEIPRAGGSKEENDDDKK